MARRGADATSFVVGTEQKVTPVTPVLEEPIEVPLAEPITLGVGKGYVPTVNVLDQRQGIGTDRTPSRVADREAEVEVGIAVEAEASVEAAHGAKGLSSNREAVALDSVDLA